MAVTIMSRHDCDPIHLIDIAQSCGVQPDQIEDVYQCTAFQLGILADSVKQAGLYTYRGIANLRQDVNVERYLEAFRHVVSLNPILRTRFVDTPVGILQVVIREPHVTDQPGGSLEDYLSSDKARPMALSQPLFRTALINRKLVVTIHHSIGDQVGNLALLRDVSRVYRGRDPEFHAPYKDFVKHCLSIDRNEAESFWESRLQSSAVHFPACDPARLPKVTQHVTTTVPLDLRNGEVSLALVPSYIEVAWALTARSYTGSDHVAYGMVFSGRTASSNSWETTLGPTLVTVPVLVSVKGSNSIRELLQERGKQRRQVQSHPALQYGIARIRQISSEARAACEFQTLLNIRPVGDRDAAIRELTFDSKHEVVGPYGVNLTCTLNAQSLLVEASSDPEILDDVQLRRVLRQFQHCLDWLLRSSPHAKIERLPLINADDSVSILEWNANVPESIENTLHELVALQASTQPGCLAVEACDGDLTYDDLEAFSQRLCDELRHLGMSPQDAVGFVFEKSRWAIVAILAIMKAGGACVPIDPSHPLARKQTTLSLAKTRFVLVSDSQDISQSDVPDVLVVKVSAEAISCLRERPELPPAEISPQSPAYIMTTSGSTGKPKGVVLEHRCLVSSLTRLIPRLRLGGDSRTLQFAAYIWDASLLEILGTLLAGGCVIIPSDRDRESQLAEFISSRHITWALLTPSVLRTLLPEQVPSLRTLITGGEAMDASASEIWSRSLQFFNAYGPCEASIISTVAQLERDSSHSGSIGRPVGCAAWIVHPDRPELLLPIGATGELVVQGSNVARGYLNDPVKTSEAFLRPLPQSLQRRVSPHRMYRTGDLVKYNSDGSICFVGRRDQQVKLRGQRFELGEVEAALLKCPQVNEVAAEIVEASSGRKELVAVISLSDQGLPSDQALQILPSTSEQVERSKSQVAAFARSMLPSHMVPTLFLAVECLPKSKSLKLDRSAIRAWVREQNLVSAKASKNMLSITAPLSPQECALQATWSSVLGIDGSRIGRKSSFISLGGDSISGMQVATRLRKSGFHITVPKLLASDSLAAAAVQTEHLDKKDTGRDCPIAVEAPESSVLSPIQALYYNQDGPASDNQFNHLWVLQLQAEFSVSRLQAALERLVSHHAMLRARLFPSPNGWRQRIEPDVKSSWSFHHTSAINEDQIDHTIRMASTEFDLQKGPVFSAHLVEQNGSNSSLILSAHHIVIDLVSWRIIWEDLEAILCDPAAEIIESTPFLTWTSHQAEDITTGTSISWPKADLGFWHLEEKTAMNTDLIRHTFTLGRDNTTTIMGASNRTFNTTPTELLLAAVVQSFLGVFPDRSRPAVFCEGHGRNVDADSGLDISRTVGWFTTLAPLNLPSDVVWSTENAVPAVKDCYREATTQSSASFGAAVSGDHPFNWRDVEILFNFAGNMQPSKREGDIFQLDSRYFDSVLQTSDSIPPTSLISISAAVHDGELVFWIEYNKLMAHQDRLVRFVGEMERSLKAFATTLPMQKTRLSLHDMKLLRASYEDLPHIHDRLSAIGIDTSNVESILPCTPMQEGILLARLKTQDSVYISRFIFKLTTKDVIDTTKLKGAWRNLCGSHPILRTVLASAVHLNGAFQQVVLKHTDPLVCVLDIPLDQDVLSSMKARSCSEFPTSLPHHRMLLARASESKAYMMIEIDHALTDARSMQLIALQLHNIYCGTAAIPQKLEFADHVAFLQENRQKSLEHWLSYLNGTQPCILPRRKTGDSTVKAINSVTVPLQPPQDLFSFCKSHNVTVANVIQLAWGLVLRQLTGSSDPLFGILISGRDSSETAPFTLGPFINMLICRVNMLQESIISAALQTVKQDLAKGMDNAACALNDIQDRLGHGSSPLFETAVSVQHSWTKQLNKDEALDIQLEHAEDPTEFAVTINVMYTDTSIQCMMFYHSARVSSGFAGEIAEAYARILHAILADGSQSIEDLLYKNGLSVPKPFSLLGEVDKSRLKRQASMQCEVSSTCIYDLFPLTPLQDEIIASAIDDHADHFVHSAFRPGPGVSLDLLCKSWDIAVASSPALRTRIVLLPGNVRFQVVLEETPMWLEYSSISEYLECSHDLAVRHGGRLVRVARIEDESAVVISFHRSICDESTFQRTVRLAQQAHAGQSIRCMESMAAVVASVGDVGERARDLWRSKLKRHSDATAFPNSVSILESEPRIVENLQIRTPCSQGDTAGLLQAAWALCLSRVTANSTVSFGVVVDSRNPSIPGWKDIGGLTTTTIPCVSTLPPSGRPQLVVDQVKHYVAQAMQYAHTSQHTIESVCEGATEYRNTLQVTFSDGVAAAESSSLMDRIPFVENIHQDHGRLTVSCVVREATTMLQMSHGPAIMSREKLKLMLRQYEHAIAQLDSSTDASEISVLEPLSRYETSLLQSWNQEPAVAIEQCVHALIREVTNDRPQSPSVCSWDRELTYRQLDTYASRLARLLQGAGAMPEVIVPFLCDKSALAPVIMLGILQSGAAMLPMEPSHPTSRLNDIAQDADASFIVCSPQFRDKASALATKVIEVDFDQLDRLSDDILEDEATPSNTCYIIYTSGSTGKPKGIIVEHRNIATSILSHLEPLAINADLRMLQIASFAFDAAVAETLFPLLVGGCICIPSDAQRQNDIAGAINDTAANFSFMTPSLARLLSPSAVPTLRTLSLMGEAMTKEDLDLWCNSTTRLICAYGPAEGAVISSCSDVMNASRSDFSNIGYPHGCRMWVTNPDDPSRLAPISSPGILIIEGPAVARGYIKDPIKTSACFISPPAWIQHFPKSRTSGGFYNTGDLVVQNVDGTVSFVGRKDNQIKIRGQRVEIGEVEYSLKKLLDSNTSVAVEAIRTDRDQTDVRLVAFLSTPSEEQGLEQRTDAAIHALAPIPGKAATLREELLTAIASYMVPDIYIPLQSLPLSHSSKLDRKRLREFGSVMSREALSRYSAFAGQARSQPLTQESNGAQILSRTERALQQLWSRVLAIPETSISASDNFMALGGNSIKAIHLVSAARKEGVDLTVVDIFQHPVLSNLAQNIGSPGVKAAEVAPFSLLSESADRAAARQHAATLCNVSEGQIEDMLPATAMQQGLLAMAAKRTGDYVAQLAFELGPDVDVTMFKQAWEQVAAVAPILRTRIVDVPDHGLLQVVIREPTSWSEYKNLQMDLTAERQREMTLGSDLSHVGLHFDAGTGRVTFAWTLHHAIYDGWSMSLLLDAIETTYKGKTPHVAPFSAFIKHVQAQKPRETADYWTSQFANLEASQFPPLPSPDYAVRADEALEHRVTDVQLGSSTLSTVLRASWALLLAAYTGTSDVVFGAVVSGRQANVGDIEHVAGPTVATVPVRVAIDREKTGATLLAQVQQQALDMIAYEQTGLHAIRSASADAELACRFQSLLLVQPEGSSAPAPGGLFAGLKKGQSANDFEAFSTYAIVLECEPRQGELHLRFALDSKVISRAQVGRMAYQLEHIMRHLCRKEVIPGPLKQLPLVASKDLRDIWSHNALSPITVDEPVHNLISTVARKQPDAPAIHAWDGDLTYRVLDEMSTMLARHLVHVFGVGPEMIVPLLFPKSMWTSVAALAVMKAGGASLLLDMAQPKERLAGVVKQSKATLLICAPALEPLASSIAPLPVTMLDWQLIEKLEQQQSDGPSLELPHVQSCNALYVVFTSGSTGTPKGAVIEHGNFASAIHHQRQKLGLNPSSRVFDLSAYAFDMAWYNILHAFANGACLCVPNDAQRKDDVSGAVHLLNPNFVCATPTFLSLLSDEALQCFETIEMAGEVCPQDFFTRLAEANKSPTNAFGPAECTAIVTSTTNEMTSPFDIGKGCGAVTWLVDPTNPAQLVPFGCVGELWIEGPLVGRGYLERPEQTSAAFVENPPWLLEGCPGHAGRRGRLYRTGDLAQYEQDGRLRYLGRKDVQVKIRGQRVELGEVEHQIRVVWRTNGTSSPNLQIVAETAKTNSDAAPKLVVFLAPAAGTVVDEQSLKKAVSAAVNGLEERLAEVLPQYMIPSAYIPLAEIPKTPSGKTDRKRLRELVETATIEFLHSTQSYSPPENELQERMQAIWSDVLNLPVTSISVDTKFSRLGDSIQAMQVVAKCRREQMEITTAELLASQGIRHLSLAHMAAQNPPGPVTTKTAEPQAADTLDLRFGLSPIQQWYFEMQAPDVCFDVPLLMRLQRSTTWASVQGAVETLVARHSMFRARFERTPSAEWVQYIQSEVESSFHGANVAARDWAEVGKIVRETRERLDMQSGPLIVVKLIDLPDGEQLLFVTSHHLVVDYVSWRVLTAELDDLLSGRVLPAHRSTSFQRWSLAQAQHTREHLHPDAALPPGTHLSPPALDFWDLTASAVRERRYAGHTLTLDAATTSRIVASTSADISPFEMLLSTLLHSFHLAFPTRALPAVFCEGHGREPWPGSDLDVSQTIGWFTTTFPVQLHTSQCTSLADTLRSAVQTYRALPNRGFDYCSTRYLHPDSQHRKDDRGAGVCELNFNFLGTFYQFEHAESLFRLIPLPPGSEPESAKEYRPVAVFDIVAYIVEGQLRVVFKYACDESFVDRLAGSFEETIRKAVDVGII